MSVLEQVRQVILKTLRAAEVPAEASYSADWAATYPGGVLSVGIGGGGSLQMGFCDYLGECYDPATATYQERYGKRLDVQVDLDAYAPRDVGAAGCERLLDQAQNVLASAAIPGLRLGEVQWETVEFDRKTDMFHRRANILCSAALIATLEEETGTLLDFRLKGEVRH